jgi:predicted SAM-dependent methyltransferase
VSSRPEPERPLRLHLGCGEQYLDGYVNIDYPPSEHSVQVSSPADEFADITALSYEPATVAEIRLHHVFEHFDRPTALRLLVDWRTWLRPGGLLWIETPDFERCARDFLVRRMFRRRPDVPLRHIFGSHEAAWAVHWDGWYEDRYRETLGTLGYSELSFERRRWQGTHNITVRARVTTPAPVREQLLISAERLLAQSLVDETISERRLLEYWVRQLRSSGSPA